MKELYNKNCTLTAQDKCLGGELHVVQLDEYNINRKRQEKRATHKQFPTIQCVNNRTNSISQNRILIISCGMSHLLLHIPPKALRQHRDCP